MNTFFKAVVMAVVLGLGFATIMVAAVAVLALFGFSHPENWPGGATTYFATLFGWCFLEGPLCVSLMAVVVATSNLLMGRPVSK
jgi:hypothetical protein